MSPGELHLRVRAGGRAFVLEIGRVAFVSRIRSDTRILRLPKRDVPLTSLAGLLGLPPGRASEAVVVAFGRDYRALAVDDAELVEDAGEDEALDIDALFLNPGASTPPR